MKKLKFSIVIALAPWRDAEILSSINNLDFPKESFEIIIEKGLNVPDNRNRGEGRAKAPIILFLDDDALIEPDFLRRVESFFEKYPKVDIVGGPQLTPGTDKFFARVSGYALEDLFGAAGASKRYKKSFLTLDADLKYITGALLIVRKRVFKKLRFDKNVYPADDVNFVTLAKKLRFKVGYSPEIAIYHRRRQNLSGLIKQIFGYGYARRAIIKETIKTPTFMIPSLFLLYLVFLPFLIILNTYFIMPLVLYIFLAVLFSFYESAKNKEVLALPILPFIFFLIHVSYGFGVIVGIISKLFVNYDRLK